MADESVTTGRVFGFGRVVGCAVLRDSDVEARLEDEAADDDFDRDL